MTSDHYFERIASFLTLLFAVSVFVWKPGIYLTSGLITGYLFWRSAVDRDYRLMLCNSRLTQISLAMFLLGLMTSIIGADQTKDVTWMARKTLFLPAIVFFVFALQNPRNHRLAMIGLIASFWIASLLTLYDYGWQLHLGGRMEGTWPLGTWDTLLGLFFAFLVLGFQWTGASHLARGIHTVTLMLALLMLLAAGGRAPWIAVLFSLGLYVALFVRDKRVLLLGLAAGMVLATLATTVFEDKTRQVTERLSTVLNTTTEGSNWIRLKLWGIGAAHLTHLAKNDPVEMLFGGGAESYDPKQIEFFKTMSFDEADRNRLADHGYPSGDAHNTYIDNALRHGVLWTLAMTLYLIWLCTRFSLAAVKNNPKPLILLLNLLIVGMFYTVVPHFATFFFMLFIALAGVGRLKTTDQRTLKSITDDPH